MTSEHREQITHGTAIEDLFGYSTGMATGSLVYVAGQLARDDTGTQIAATDLDSKMAQVVKNIRSVVERLGSSLEEVASLQIHVTNEVDDLEDAFAVCKSTSGAAPAVTIVPVERLRRRRWARGGFCSRPFVVDLAARKETKMANVRKVEGATALERSLGASRAVRVGQQCSSQARWRWTKQARSSTKGRWALSSSAASRRSWKSCSKRR